MIYASSGKRVFLIISTAIVLNLVFAIGYLMNYFKINIMLFCKFILS